MENLALHQRSLLLMVDVWRPACTWHRLHCTLFWVLIRQACSENHLTAHHDCSQMLQKMASPLRLTATAVILTNVKQEATLSDAKRFLVVQKTHDFLCDLSKHSPDGFMGAVTSLNKTLNAFCKLWSFWEWEKNHPALSNEPSITIATSIWYSWFRTSYTKTVISDSRLETSWRESWSWKTSPPSARAHREGANLSGSSLWQKMGKIRNIY